MEDIRYSEFLFLPGVARGEISTFITATGLEPPPLDSNLWISIWKWSLAFFEDLHIRVENTAANSLVLRLRGELPDKCDQATHFPSWPWANPREGLKQYLRSNTVSELAITYRGLQRIEELRELLHRDRILDRFGVLSDLRYFHQELMR